MATLPDLDPRGVAELGARLRENVARAVKAPEQALRDVVVAVIAEGHVLIEDYPGVGKTALARALARSVDAEYARVQCTADLLPADMVGTNVFNQRENRFEFRPGPGVRERGARGRGQPRLAQDAVGPPRVHAGAARDGGQAHPRAGPAVRGAGHAEPDRVRGHLPAARGPARPLHGPGLARLSHGRPGERHARRPRRARPGARPRAGGRRGRHPGRSGGGRRRARQRGPAPLHRRDPRRRPARTRGWSWAAARAPG